MLARTGDPADSRDPGDSGDPGNSGAPGGSGDCADPGEPGAGAMEILAIAKRLGIANALLIGLLVS